MCYADYAIHECVSSSAKKNYYIYVKIRGIIRLIATFGTLKKYLKISQNKEEAIKGISPCVSIR